MFFGDRFGRKEGGGSQASPKGAFLLRPENDLPDGSRRQVRAERPPGATQKKRPKGECKGSKSKPGRPGR